jgi:hypothetical protein
MIEIEPDGRVRLYHQCGFEPDSPWCVADEDEMLPGVYESRDAARLALTFDRDVLLDLRDGLDQP